MVSSPDHQIPRHITLKSAKLYGSSLFCHSGVIGNSFFVSATSEEYLLLGCDHTIYDSQDKAGHYTENNTRTLMNFFKLWRWIFWIEKWEVRYSDES